jgi:hypothetical protein
MGALSKDSVNVPRDDSPARELARYDASASSIRQGGMTSHEILRDYVESEQ